MTDDELNWYVGGLILGGLIVFGTLGVLAAMILG